MASKPFNKSEKWYQYSGTGQARPVRTMKALWGSKVTSTSRKGAKNTFLSAFLCVYGDLYLSVYLHIYVNVYFWCIYICALPGLMPNICYRLE